ncbi:hypothetical protein H1R20_g7780, partial [Candolleomyces eurysporus]
MHASYVYLVTHFNDPEALRFSNWSFRLAILNVAGPPLLSNAFYVSRLWIIGVRNIPFLLGMGALMLTRFTFQLILAAQAWRYPLLSEFRRFYWMVRAYCGASVVADILLASYFCWTLHKRRTGYARYVNSTSTQFRSDGYPVVSTDSKIDLLMIYSINTGLLCLLALMSLVFIGTGFVYVGLHYLLGKLYVNSVLAVLNSRKPRHKLDESVYEIAAFDSRDSRPKSGKIVFRRTTADSEAPIDIQGMIRIRQETSTHISSDSAVGTGITESTVQNTEKIELEKM